MTIQNKQWKKVAGYPKYSVSTLGDVRNDNTHKILRWQRCAGGGFYPFVNLYNDGIRKNMLVHFLVATTFIGPRPKGKHIDHKDSNIDNPAVDNLQYLTVKENMAKRRNIKK